MTRKIAVDDVIQVLKDKNLSMGEGMATLSIAAAMIAAELQLDKERFLLGMAVSYDHFMQATTNGGGDTCH